MAEQDSTDFLAEMDDARLLAYADSHWANHQQIIRGKSNKAADGLVGNVRPHPRREARAGAVMIFLSVGLLWLTIGLTVPGCEAFAIFSVVFFVLALNER